MLKMRELCEVPVLFKLQSHPSVYPYVREKAETSDAYYFIIKQTIEAEENGELISRTIIDEYHQPIGTITLYDIHNQHGFLATWIGQPYFGKGYNKMAKTLFFHEIFSQYKLQAILMKIRKSNVRSLRAATKLPYVRLANTLFSERSEEHTSELQSRGHLVCRLLLHPPPISTLFPYTTLFRSTWIGQPYFGKGYNKMAKTLFFHEIFSQYKLQAILMKIRKSNVRSLRAATKLPYVRLANTLFSEIYKDINREEDIYDLFVITKKHYDAYAQFSGPIAEDAVTGGEDVS